MPLAVAGYAAALCQHLKAAGPPAREPTVGDPPSVADHVYKSRIKPSVFYHL